MPRPPVRGLITAVGQGTCAGGPGPAVRRVLPSLEALLDTRGPVPVFSLKISKPAAATLHDQWGTQVRGACLEPGCPPQGGREARRGLHRRGCCLPAAALAPGLLPPLGSWTSPLNPPPPPLPFFSFWGLALNYLVLFTLHPSSVAQKTCRCKYVPPSLTSPPFLIYVISVSLPCAVN